MQSSSVHFSWGGGGVGYAILKCSLFLGGKAGWLEWNRSLTELNSLEDKHLMMEKIRGTYTREGREPRTLGSSAFPPTPKAIYLT